MINIMVMDYFFLVSRALYTALQYCVPCTICNLSIVKANKHIEPTFTLISVLKPRRTLYLLFLGSTGAPNARNSSGIADIFTSYSDVKINVAIFRNHSCCSSPLLLFVHPPLAFDLRESSPNGVQMFLKTVPATWLWRSTSSLPTGIEETAVMWIV